MCKYLRFMTAAAFLAMFTLTAVPVVLAAQPGALPTTHYLAYKIEMLTSDTSTTSTIAGIATKPNVVTNFVSLDQFTCNAGKYELTLRIVKPEDNTIVAATKPIVFTVADNGSVYSQPTQWQVTFPAAGWYRYDVLLGNRPLGTYYFMVTYGQ